MSYLNTARKTKARLSGRRPEPAKEDPMLTVEQWYPEFHKLRLQVTAETPAFDYGALREQQPDLYRQMKAKESELDALDVAPLSQVMAIMAEWRNLILKSV